MNSMFFEIALVFFLPCFDACPSSWTLYKTILEGPFDAINIQGSFHINRTIRYKCKKNEEKFQTDRQVEAPQFDNFKCKRSSGFGECKNECNCKKQIIKTEYQLYNDTGFMLTIAFVYNNKNCDKLYWTNWNESADSLSSTNHSQTKHCVDCDGIVFPFQRYCPKKETGGTIQCQPTWSSWVKESCSATNCSSIGKRLKTRSCLYDDGSESLNHLLFL